MVKQYFVPNVSAEFVMDSAKILANATVGMDQQTVARCFEKEYSLKYVGDALEACSQLGLAIERAGFYLGSEELRGDLKRASKEELYVPFQARLKQYPPFLLYVDFASKGYTSIEAAARARGILQVGGPTEAFESSMRKWGSYSRLVGFNRTTGDLVVKVDVERLTAEYVSRLLKAFQADLKARLFMIDLLGPETFAYIDGLGVDLDDLTTALLEYETDPKEAAAQATRALELALWKICEASKIDPSGANGVIELAERLKGGKSILTNQLQIMRGLGGIRNMAHHDPDKETARPWAITKEGALITTLLVPTALRSLHHYVAERKQSF